MGLVGSADDGGQLSVILYMLGATAGVAMDYTQRSYFRFIKLVEGNDLKLVKNALKVHPDFASSYNPHFLYMPLHVAPSVAVATLLIESGADVNALDSEECRTPLHCVASVEVAKLLIGAGGHVNARDREGFTPLHFANDADIAKALIESGADVNVQSEEGLTPLHLNSIPQVAQVLIEWGADTELLTNDGESVLSEELSNASKREAIRSAIENRDMKRDLPPAINKKPGGGGFI